MLIYNVSLRYEITRAQLLIETTPARLEVETERNGYRMDSRPIQMQMDSSRFYESLGIKSTSVALKEAAERGKQAVLDSMARYTREKNAKLGPDAMTVAEIAAKRNVHSVWTAMRFIPDAKPEISWKDGYVDIEYERDERKVNFIPAKVECEYIPYKVEIFAEVWAEKYPPEEFTEGFLG